ncbi:hypothetical protein [Polyangium fumosum]|uniref:Uncharacterized protein n=1 Tax=Polyangium fumosum TaxID=889272 RepID=A0A4U1JA37_9BACT|nr:hypothetical protein [Polyangium fumosum]TKD05305.1 hypothetical protein E8A74_21140 [Polyangium fumosum]
MRYQSTARPLRAPNRAVCACATALLMLWGRGARAEEDAARSYISLIADASLRKGFVGGDGASGSGAIGVDLQVPTFGLFFVGQASASNALRGDRMTLASSIIAPAIGTGAGLLDVRITPLGRSRLSPFVTGISLRLDGSVTGFSWETEFKDGSTLKTSTLYNVTFGAMLSYRLDIVGIARENKVKIGRDQDIVVALDIGFTGRYIAGDNKSFARIMTPAFTGSDVSVSLFFPAPCARVQLMINHARFFIEAPYFLDKGVPELRGLSLFIGGGVRGDVYCIYDSSGGNR